MTMRMLIDARHQEETRVAVVKGNRIEEFDFESAEHKQLKGNIYLAKVTRVERSEEHTSELPSLMRISYAVFCLKKKNTSQKHSQSNRSSTQSTKPKLKN